jgi:hypothetical protein
VETIGNELGLDCAFLSVSSLLPLHPLATEQAGELGESEADLELGPTSSSRNSLTASVKL